MRRALTVARRVLLTLVLVTGLVYGSSWLLTPYSGMARAIAWMESDTGDWRRFPSRPIRAPAVTSRLTVERPPPELLAAHPTGDNRDLEEFLEDTATTSFIVMRDDTVLFEWYGNGEARDSFRTSFSVAKSWLSALVGIAIDEGHIRSLEDPITRYVPGLAERDPRFGRITLRHLITMSSGLRYEEAPLPWSDDAQTYYAVDLPDYAIDHSEIVEPPGQRWLYNNYNPLLVGLALERAVGMTVAEYLELKIWQPIGMEFDGSWSLDSKDSGFEKMESGLNARAIDYARFGRLYLNQGSWDGEQVVPRAWVEASTRRDTETDPAPYYQYFWWVDDAPDADGAFMARGKYSQYIYVAPADDLVFVRLGDDDGYPNWPGVFRSLIPLLREG
ncbi:MAG: serine hydrolase domain-containing protein [Actinomycetota bacterium]